MQRVLLKSLGSRNVNRSIRLTRPTISLFTHYKPQASFIATRFNSTKAKDTTPKEEDVKEEPKEEVKEEPNQEPTEDPIITELREKLEKKDKDLASMKNHYARSVADFRSLQETTKKEVQKAKDFALQKFAKDLLPSLDNFNLALSHVKEETLKTNNEVKNLYDGVDMTRNIFEKTLSKHGIKKINPIDQVFDPNLHEATFEISQPDKEPGTVFYVQQEGYTLNSRVLRPAKVGVVKGEEEEKK
ncbi:unnamed protein product [Candida verbasci]|uniref:GrpE protein homolog n=1 Tax=Candida verbasci TaxID=1227364 RepID=A0A9W4TSA1_9ASCO|nr:unnamed protein product [Candida verbasci]